MHWIFQLLLLVLISSLSACAAVPEKPQSFQFPSQSTLRSSGSLDKMLDLLKENDIENKYYRSYDNDKIIDIEIGNTKNLQQINFDFVQLCDRITGRNQYSRFHSAETYAFLFPGGDLNPKVPINKWINNAIEVINEAQPGEPMLRPIDDQNGYLCKEYSATASHGLKIKYGWRIIGSFREDQTSTKEIHLVIIRKEFFQPLLSPMLATYIEKGQIQRRRHERFARESRESDKINTIKMLKHRFRIKGKIADNTSGSVRMGYDVGDTICKFGRLVGRVGAPWGVMFGQIDGFSKKRSRIKFSVLRYADTTGMLLSRDGRDPTMGAFKLSAGLEYWDSASDWHACSM